MTRFFTIKIFAVLSFIIFLSCSSNDDVVNDQLKNEFTFNGESYKLTTTWINDENIINNDPSDIGISIFNKSTLEINSGNDLTNINFVYFDFSEVELQETTYTNILDYDVSINGTFTNGSFDPGTIFLSDDTPNSDFFATNSIVTINKLTDTTVDLSFSFTRSDGEKIEGSFSGNYVVPDSN